MAAYFTGVLFIQVIVWTNAFCTFAVSTLITVFIVIRARLAFAILSIFLRDTLGAIIFRVTLDTVWIVRTAKLANVSCVDIVGGDAR
jgi:hypothetical protein